MKLFSAMLVTILFAPAAAYPAEPATVYEGKISLLTNDFITLKPVKTKANAKLTVKGGGTMDIEIENVATYTGIPFTLGPRNGVGAHYEAFLGEKIYTTIPMQFGTNGSVNGTFTRVNTGTGGQNRVMEGKFKLKGPPPI